MKTLSPYRQTLALKQTIKDAATQIRALEAAASADRAIRGLKACARAKVTLDFDQVHQGGVWGKMIGPIDGYEVSKLFDFSDYHSYIDLRTKEMDLSIHTDDGVVTIGITWVDKLKEPAELGAKLKAVGTHLKQYGLKLTTNKLQTKRDNLAKEIADIDSLIAEVNP